TPDEYTSLQLATYISQALYQQFRNGNKPIEPIIAIVFYNGKKSWKPKTVSELFEDHPYYEFFASYLPNFKFEFLDIAHFPKDRLIELQRGFLKSALLAMANRFKPDLLIQFLYIIFEVEGERDFQAIVQYYLAILDRSPKQFRDELKNIEFANKPRLMSTLEMLINEGLEEGLEKGIKKGLKKGLKQGLEKGLKQGLEQGKINTIITNLELLLKTKKKFPNLDHQDIADISAFELVDVQAFYQILEEYSSEKMTIIQALQTQFFKDLPIDEAQLDRLHQLVESY
ncbi:MAG: Rpn family recombination-promoting nuclease/putative transposase, partial [Bacteroidota bacterium]